MENDDGLIGTATVPATKQESDSSESLVTLLPKPMFAQLQPSELPTSGYTVLIVDDEAAVRTVIVRLLLRNGYKVLEASNACEARKFSDLISKGGVDLVLTDVVMPGLSGVELAIHLRTINPQIGILLMSGMVPAPIMILLKRFAFPLLEKPFDGPTLIRSVANAVSTLPSKPKAEAPQRGLFSSEYPAL
jgi:DNA-binding NtrC family response regulator